MFGRQDNHADNTSSNDVANQPAAEPSAVSSPFGKSTDTTVNNSQTTNATGAPLVEPTVTAPVETNMSVLAPSSPNLDDLSLKSSAVSDSQPTNADTSSSANDDLISLKQQALQQLTPLVGHLDQTPEEKFRTTMMMIQGADNQALIKDAYEAAQNISDEKLKAQALLDIVNEINYFTHKQEAEHS